MPSANEAIVGLDREDIFKSGLISRVLFTVQPRVHYKVYEQTDKMKKIRFILN